jgi:hypothetical protein
MDAGGVSANSLCTIIVPLDDATVLLGVEALAVSVTEACAVV